MTRRPAAVIKRGLLVVITRTMGIAIQCILEQDIAGIGHMEGKSLAMAYCGDSGPALPEDGENDAGADIISIDFGSGKSQPFPPAAPSPTESLLAPLDPFVANAGEVQWHDAAKGLEAVRTILEKLRDGATLSIAEDFPFADEDANELTEGVRFDLEELEKILTVAWNKRTRFHLAFDI